MKRGILPALAMFLFCASAFCVEISYVVTQDTQLSMESNNMIKIPVSKGETVFFQGKTRSPFDYREIFVKTSNGQEGWVNAGHILLMDNKPLPVFVTGRIWIPGYYQQFLSGAEKEKLLDCEPYLTFLYDELVRGSLYELGPWWDLVDVKRFTVHNNFVDMLNVYGNVSNSFVTVSQHYDGDTVELQVLCIRGLSKPEAPPKARFTAGNTYRLTLKTDGDYMDVFVDGGAQPIETLVGVDAYFAGAVYDFFRDGEADMSRIIWPRRADGSTDFPPPEGVTFWAEETGEPETGGQATEADQDLQAESATENSSSTNSVPARALAVIIGAAVLVAGGIVLFAVKRKRAKA